MKQQVLLVLLVITNLVIVPYNCQLNFNSVKDSFWNKAKEAEEKVEQKIGEISKKIEKTTEQVGTGVYQTVNQFQKTQEQVLKEVEQLKQHTIEASKQIQQEIENNKQKISSLSSKEQLGQARNYISQISQRANEAMNRAAEIQKNVTNKIAVEIMNKMLNQMTQQTTPNNKKSPNSLNFQEIFQTINSIQNSFQNKNTTLDNFTNSIFTNYTTPSSIDQSLIQILSKQLQVSQEELFNQTQQILPVITASLNNNSHQVSEILNSLQQSQNNNLIANNINQENTQFKEFMEAGILEIMKLEKERLKLDKKKEKLKQNGQGSEDDEDDENYTEQSSFKINKRRFGILLLVGGITIVACFGFWIRRAYKRNQVSYTEQNDVREFTTQLPGVDPNQQGGFLPTGYVVGQVITTQTQRTLEDENNN